MAHAAQKVVLRSVQLLEPDVLVGDAREQLGVSQADADDRGEQLEEVLVGAIPAGGGRRVADDRTEGLGAGAEVRPDGQGIAGNALLGRDVRWVAQHDPGVDQPEREPGVRDREIHEAVGALAR